MRETNFRKVEFSIVSLPKNERNATNHRKEKGIIAFLFLFVCLFVLLKGHIRYSSQVPICSDYIFGNCNHGSNCDNHHCPLPYLW